MTLLHLSVTFLAYKFYNDSFLGVEGCRGSFHAIVLSSEVAVLGPVYIEVGTPEID